MSFLDLLFLLALVLSAIQRLIEAAYSQANQILLAKKGYALRETKLVTRNRRLFVCVWIIAAASEWYLQIFNVPESIKILGFLTFLFAQILRLWTIKSLGEHWSTVIFAPDKVDTPSLGALTKEAMISGKTEQVEKAIKENLFVATGLYKFVRHPNYLSQIIEVAALPLCGGAVISALIFSFWNNHLLNKYIDLEESWLFSRPGYHELFYHKSRFIPF